MLSLYEITGKYQELFDLFDNANIEDEDAIQAYFDTLEAIEGEFNEKAENIAVFIKTLSAEAEELKKEKQQLEARQKSKENKVKRLKEYLLSNMHFLGVKKIESARARITMRQNAESVKIANEKAFIDWAEKNDCDFLNFNPTISKSAIKEALQGGKEVPYCELQRMQSVIIK